MSIINLKPASSMPDPNRKALAAAISLYAGAKRDLIVAEQAAAAAKQKWWDAEARLDELRKEAPSPGGYLSDETIAMIASGAACDTDVLDQSAVESGARMKSFENDIRTWEAASAQCDLAVKAKAESAVTAKERLERAARVVIANSENVTRLLAGLEEMQTEVINRRVALRFVWGKGLNGELSGQDKERIERALCRDLTGMESHPAHGAWRAAFDALMSDAEAELP